MKHSAPQEIGTSFFYKLQHYQMSLQFIVAECEGKDIQIIEANDEIKILRERQTKHEAEKNRLSQAVSSAEAKAQAAVESLTVVQQECSEAKEKLEALQSVFTALIESRRFLGFNRSKFRRKVMSLGERTPISGPQAVRHAVLLAKAREALKIDSDLA